jgi:hypothetical protein
MERKASMYTLLLGLPELFHSISIYVCIYMHVRICVCICVCVNVYTYVCLSIHTHTHKPNHTYEFRNNIKKLWVTCSRICKKKLQSPTVVHAM